MSNQPEFVPGMFYKVDYLSFAKTAVYLGFQDGKHYFFDDNGKYAFTPEYLEQGKIKIEPMEGEEQCK